MELKRETKFDLDLSSEIEVLSYTHTGSTSREVIARIDLGDTDGPLSGDGGTYQLNFYIDDVLITPNSSVIVPAGRTKTIMVSRQVPIEPGDVVSIKITGHANDSAVTVVSTLRDATPLRSDELTGGGSVEVDHDYGGDDNLAYQTLAGAGISNASVRIYLTSNYAAGQRSTDFVIATAITGALGRWLRPVMLDPGSYTIVYYKQDSFGPDAREITVS